jgi:hypothetical protein
MAVAVAETGVAVEVEETAGGTMGAGMVTAGIMEDTMGGTTTAVIITIRAWVFITV